MRQDLRGRLRPMGIADILDETVELYKSNFVLLVGISAILYAPYSLVQSLVGNIDKSTPERMVFQGILEISIAVLFLLFCQPAVTGALLFALSDRYLGRATSIRSCYARILKSSVFLPMLGSIILQYLAIFGCAMAIGLLAALYFVSAGGIGTPSFVSIFVGVLFVLAAIVLIVILGVRLALVEPAVIVESKGAGQALNRSWQLMQGNAMKGFLLFLITLLLVAIITGAVTAPTAIIQAMSQRMHSPVSPVISVLHALLTMIVSTLTFPFTSIVAILLYYDIRIRKEGFDLELLANELSRTTQQFGAYDQYNQPQEQIPAQELTQEVDHSNDSQ